MTSVDIKTPEVIVFDIGNVLLHWDPDQLYAELIPDEAARKKFYRTVDTYSMNVEIDRGGPFRETIYATAEKYPEFTDLVRAWHDRWIDMAKPLIEESCEILLALRRQKFPVFALSNFGVDSFAYAETVYPILKEFDRRYISGHLKVVKPDPAIYEALEADSGLTGDSLFFTDDSAKNIAAARARGWQAELFTTPALLRTALADRGINL